MGDEVARFCSLGSAAEQFDWGVPDLFVDRAGADQTQEVSHMLNRALTEYQGSDDRFRTRLGAFLD